jgi:hypothetical protein
MEAVSVLRQVLIKSEGLSNRRDSFTLFLFSIGIKRQPDQRSRYADYGTAGQFEVETPAHAGDFSLLQNIQACSEAHPASYSMGTGGKAAQA